MNEDLLVALVLAGFVLAVVSLVYLSGRTGGSGSIVLRAISVLALVLVVLVLALVGLWLTVVGVAALVEGGYFDDAGDSSRAVGAWMTPLGLLLLLAAGTIVVHRIRLRHRVRP